jgi:DNA-binding transcriptional ArsR family regulator
MAILRRTSVIDGKLVIEEIEDPNLITVRKKDKMKGGDFIVVFQNAMKKLVLDDSFGKNEYRILFYLMAKTEFENEINDTLYNIAKEIGLDQSTSGKAMRKLESVGIVIRNIQLRTFRLNYELAYKGHPKNYKKLQFKDPVFLEKKKDEYIQTDIITEINKIENGDE